MQDRAVGQLLGGLVVVGDDHLDPGRLGRGHLGDRADPAVDGDQQRGAAPGQFPDRRRGEPVAVVQAAGDQPVAVRSELAQGRDQDRGRADAVDVVVAVHGDPPAIGDRGADPIGDLGHRVEAERIVVVGRFEEGPCLIDGPVAATNQGHRDRFGQPEPFDQGSGLGIVVGLEREPSSGIFRHAPKLG